MKTFKCPYCNHRPDALLAVGNIPLTAPAFCEVCLKLFIVDLYVDTLVSRFASDEEMKIIEAGPMYQNIIMPMIRNIRAQRSAMNN